MFENIIAQAATVQLKNDILAHRLAPSMLFFGPPASGKGSAAIELARALSCEKGDAHWNCTCSACTRHKSLLHPDLVMLGPRAFAAEIAAARAAFLRDPASAAARSLFIRSLRKLLARFSPAVWEYESKSGRINPLSLLQSLEEDIDELESQSSTATAGGTAASLEKLTDSLTKNAFKLEDECVSENIPIAQIRKAAWWSRLTPTGKRKTLVIENADRMKDESRNSLLKLLEEPPESLTIVLSTVRRESLLATILSRLRPYRFLARSAAEERDIIRRIFRDQEGNLRPLVSVEDQGAGIGEEKGNREQGSGIRDQGSDDESTSKSYSNISNNNPQSPSSPQSPVPDPQSLSSSHSPNLVATYLDSFLPQPPEKLLPLAAFFVAAVARSAAIAARSRGDIPPTLKALGSYCAPIAESAEFERMVEAKEVIAVLLSRSSNFEGRSFPRFLALALDLVSWSMTQYITGPARIACGDIWRRRLGEAQAAYGVWNQRPELALESLFHQLREDMAAA